MRLKKGLIEMKKKEVLVIFVLAVLATGGSWFFLKTIHNATKCFPGNLYCPLPYNEYSRGFPLSWYRYGSFILNQIVYQNFLLDILFWFLVIFGVWQARKIFRKK